MTKIKLWVSDIDGTLLNYDGTTTKKMLSVIEKINTSDTKLVLATGRMFMGAQFQADKFNLKTPVICYQGAVVRNKDEVLWQRPINDKLSREVIEYLRNNKVHTHIYTNDILYIEDDNKKIMDEYCNGRGTTYEVVDNFDDVDITSGCAKILGVIYDEEKMKRIKKELQEKYKGVLTIVQSAKMYLEVNDIGATKGEALKFLKEYWNLADDEVLASGDQDNDVELLKNAGVRVCVGSNSEKIKEVAQYHCSSVDSDELPELIERLVLCV